MVISSSSDRFKIKFDLQPLGLVCVSIKATKSCDISKCGFTACSLLSIKQLMLHSPSSIQSDTHGSLPCVICPPAFYRIWLKPCAHVAVKEHGYCVCVCVCVCARVCVRMHACVWTSWIVLKLKWSESLAVTNIIPAPLVHNESIPVYFSACLDARRQELY